MHLQTQTEVQQAHQETLRNVLEGAGWHFISQDLLNETLPDFEIPHLGSLHPPTLEDFLFFWTD